MPAAGRLVPHRVGGVIRDSSRRFCTEGRSDIPF